MFYFKIFFFVMVFFFIGVVVFVYFIVREFEVFDIEENESFGEYFWSIVRNRDFFKFYVV